MSMEDDHALPIKRFGREWRVWTRLDLLRFVDQVKAATDKKLVTLSDLVIWCVSIAGVDQALAVAGGITVAEVQKCGTDWQRYALANELVNRFCGEATSDEANPPAAAMQTGDSLTHASAATLALTH